MFNKSKLQKPIYAGTLACFCCLLWGSAFPVIKIGYEQLKIASDDYMSQILFAGLRFTLAGVLTIAFGRIFTKSSVKISKRGLYKIPVLAVFQTILQYLFFYIGLAKTTGTKGSIVNSTSVFFSVIIACIFLRERLTAKRLLGCVIGFAGVIIINLSGADTIGSVSFFGEGFIILSSISYAVSSVLIKCFSKNESPVLLSGYQFMSGGAVMIAIGASFGGRFPIDGVIPFFILLYLAALSAIAYTLWGVLLKYNQVSDITVYSFMTPVFGCVLSALLLKESFAENAAATIASLALVCFGIYLVNSKNKEKNNES